MRGGDKRYNGRRIMAAEDEPRTETKR